MDEFKYLCCLFAILPRVMASLPSWNMHYVCGQTISRTDRGGYLYLNADLLPPGHQSDCRVVIQPKSTESSSTSGSYVLFYFSSFGVGHGCQDSNVTIYDGNGIGTKQIEGLKQPMCGLNSSLTKDVTFRTQSFFLTVVFRRGPAGYNFKSKFNLTFISFSEGPCESDDDTFFSCKNNRCIDNKFTCQDLNPCGDNSDCPSKEETSLWEDIFNKIKIVLVVIIILLVVVGFIKFCKKVKGRVGDICRDLADCVVNACRRIKRSVTSARETQRTRYNDRTDYDQQPRSVSIDSPDIIRLGRPRRGNISLEPESMSRPSTLRDAGADLSVFNVSDEYSQRRHQSNLFLRNRSISSVTSDEFSVTDSLPRGRYFLRSSSRFEETGSLPEPDIRRSHSDTMARRTSNSSQPSLESLESLELQPRRFRASSASGIYDEFTVSDLMRTYFESETGSQSDAPPSYREVALALSSDHYGLPPSYDEAIAGVTKYDKR